MKNYYVYIMSSRTRVFYTGMTSNLMRQIFEHRRGLMEGFTKRYKVTRLVYYEGTQDPRSAIAWERRIKGP